MVLTIIVSIVVISVLSMIIFPKIIESLVSVIQQASSLLGGLIRNIDGILSFFGIDYTLTSISELMQFVNLDWPSIFQKALDFLTSTTGGVVSLLTSFGASIAWAFAGFMLSLYLLAQKETYILQFRKLMTVMLGTQRARRFFKVSSLANEIFKSFVGGQLIEACVQWALYWVLLTLLGFPFPELLSTIIAVFALVPVFGPTISMFLNGLLVLTVKSPLYVIWFFVIYQVIQQFDNNVIYPRIVGKQVGLPGIWVLLSIFVFGDLFGLIGMLVAVPTTAFLYALLTQFVGKTLRERQVTVTLTNVIENNDSTIIQP
ncbi:MAG: AI-2E family transporter [Erysipelotrichaceae bacterium]